MRTEIMSAKRIFFGAFLTAAVTSAVGASWYFTRIEPELRLPGVVEIQEVRLSSKVGGRIKLVHAQEGQIVSQGQPLVIIDLPEWEAKRGQQQAQLKLALAQLEKAQNGCLPEEKSSAKGTLGMAQARLLRLRAGTRSEEIESALKEWTGQQFEVQKALKNWQREQTLSKQQATSQADYDAAWAAYAKARDQAKAAEERWKLAKNGPRAEDIAEAEAEVAKLQANLDLLLRGTRSEEIAEAEARVLDAAAKLKEMEVQLREGVVEAPNKALVEVVSVRRGDTVAANQTVVRILLAEDLWVKVYVPEPQLGKVHLNQTVRVSNDSFPGKWCKGVVTHIASASEFTPRNVQSSDERRNQVFAVKVRVCESAEVFKSGMAAEVLIPLAQP
jgi:HlyD family secretion protein